jgi:hypothetical protein
MKIKRILSQIRFLLLSLAPVLAMSAAPVRAQDAPPSDDNGIYNGPDNRDYDAPDTGQDPPSRVARLSYLDGTVSFQPGGQGEWGQATRNRPVTIGDKIWADNNSRAELQAGQASIRISSMTALSFLNLDDQTTQMRLAEGTINFRVRELREGDVYEVDTPNVAFNVTQAGAFRVDVNENGDRTRITAIRGEGQVIANDQTYTIHAGESGEFNGTDDVTYFVSAAPAPDGFDRWANDRDRKEDSSVSARYVSRDVPGYSDLDDNGTWNEEPDYGPVWYPSTVDVGWAPYSYGYWNYVGPWGWTWVDYSPWGFAPFHYGRWAYIGSRWGWCPGPYDARPVYGPAFVGFIGGSHWGVGLGFGGYGGGIGWFPLGPREPFRPWYRTSGRYYRNVNYNNTYIRNTTIINNRSNNFNYAYAHNTRAVTVTSRNNFVNGQRINRGAFHVTEASLRGAQVSNRANFTPTRQSYVGGNGAHGNIARPSAAIENRSVMARSAPARGASHMPVRTFGGNNNPPAGGGFDRGNTSGSRGPAMGRAAQMGAAVNGNRPSFSGDRNGNSPQSGARPNMPGNQGRSNRQRELANDKPQSHMRNAPSDSGLRQGTRGSANAGDSRNWSAQGSTTDRGRAPSGFGSNSPRSQVPRGTAMSGSDRPSWSGSGSNNSGHTVSPRSSDSSNRPNSSNSNRGGNPRSYDSPQRNPSYSSDRPSSYNSNPNRGNVDRPQRSSGPPQRSYSAPSQSQPRSYSPPSRSSGPPQRSYSAPSQSQPRSYSSPARSSGPPQRSYSPTQSQPRSYSPPMRSSAPPQRSYATVQSQPRSYSAPSRSYAAPSRGYSAPPSRSSGGGSPRGGGGGNPVGSRGGGSRGGGSPHGRH